VTDQQTCGQGLAENSELPAKLGDLTESMAEILEIHMGALDLEDNDSRREHEAYRELVKDHRRIAAALLETARRMAGYRDLPMGRHHTTVMSSRRAVEASEKFVKLEEELLSMLQKRLEADRRMLSEMRGARS
jgi:transposase